MVLWDDIVGQTGMTSSGQIQILDMLPLTIEDIDTGSTNIITDTAIWSGDSDANNETTGKLVAMTWSMSSNTPTPIPDTLDLTSDPEYVETINRLRDHHIITTSVETFRPFDHITREEAAKIFSQFYTQVLQYTGIVGASNSCNFTDITETDYTLTDFVKSSCSFGILKWSDWYFFPTQHLSKLQMIVILVRMFENQFFDESQEPRHTEYILQAKWYGILSNTNELVLNSDVSRYELVMTLYRYYIKHNLIQNINKPHSRLKLLMSVPNTIKTNTQWQKTTTVMVNINQLDQNLWYKPTIDIFDTTYLVRQTKNISYTELKNSFARYGNLIDIWSNTIVWTISFIIFDNMIEFGTIRPNNSWWHYTIRPYEAGYYTLTEIK
jgi:hypothetical protein